MKSFQCTECGGIFWGEPKTSESAGGALCEDCYQLYKEAEAVQDGTGGMRPVDVD